jgi:hypothetical protein
MPGDPSTTTCNTAVMTSCTPAAGDDKKEHAVLQVMLKRTARKVVPATGLFDKLFFGDKEWAQESLDQAHYLNQIYQSFAALGYDNIILMVVNEKVVYKDTQRQPGDFATALRLALDEQVQEDFDIAFALDKGQDGLCGEVQTIARDGRVPAAHRSYERRRDDEPDRSTRRAVAQALRRRRD